MCTIITNDMYCTVQCGTVQYSTVQYSTVQNSTVQYSTVQVTGHNEREYSAVMWSTVHHTATTDTHRTTHPCVVNRHGIKLNDTVTNSNYRDFSCFNPISVTQHCRWGGRSSAIIQESVNSNSCNTVVLLLGSDM